MRLAYFVIALACCGFSSQNLLFSTPKGSHTRAKTRHKKGLTEVAPLPKIVKASFGEDSGLILHSSFIPISAPHANYNPSIVAYGNGYLMSFRHDIPDPNTLTPVQRRGIIGLVRLDASFRPIEEPKYLELEERYRDCEDTRLFYIGEKLYLCCCVFFPAQEISRLGVAELDQQTLEARWITTLDKSNPLKIEKNWVPVVYNEDLYFLYSLTPHVVLQTEQSTNGVLTQKTNPLSSAAPVPKLVRRWTKKWGFISGGTPAIRMEDKYLTIFHSHFWANNEIWYVMGAALLEGHPPFRPVKISRRPIIFKKMYAAPHHPDPLFRLSPIAHVVFPSGIVEGAYRGKSVFHVVYGDNDSAAGVVTISKTKLLKTLHTVK